MHLLLTSQQGDVQTKACTNASAQHYSGSFPSCMETSVQLLGFTIQNLFLETEIDIFFISEGLHRSDPASFKACVRQRASFFNISIVRSCYLSFSMERMAHELFPQQLLYISSFSCKGMSMSLYCKTLFLFPSSSSKIELETCLYYEQE